MMSCLQATVGTSKHTKDTTMVLVAINEKDIREWVQQCPVCQKHNRNYNKIAGKLAPIIATRPFQIMGMDILTDLPETPRGNVAIVLFTDYYTKWVEAFALKT